MLTFEEARSRILALAPSDSPRERIGLELAAGRVLVEDIVSDRDHPGHDHSAMDGYALRADDLVGEGPWHLPVLGESKTGIAGLSLVPGTTCRIFTGAPLPGGADAVVMQENVVREGEVATFTKRPERGVHIRRRGEDLRRGGTALRQGTRLSARHLSMVASLDRTWLEVARAPRVTVISTGDELRPSGSPQRAGTIPESIALTLATMARGAGAGASIAPIVPDLPEVTEQAFLAALDVSDVVVTVGGASVGDHDLVKPALEKVGVALEFWKVAIKPGKPLLVGRRGRTLVLGLPGNPSSAIVTFATLGLPLIRALQGDRRPVPMSWRARLARAITRPAGRLELARASFAIEDGSEGVPVAHLHSNQASGATTGLIDSDGLVIIPLEATRLEAGALVDAWTWSELGA